MHLKQNITHAINAMRGNNQYYPLKDLFKLKVQQKLACLRLCTALVHCTCDFMWHPCISLVIPTINYNSKKTEQFSAAVLKW
jgi:hypothetical protein